MAVPYMPLYVSDYLADTAHLSTEEHGAYLLLIMTYWQRGGALPNDPRKLSRIAGVSLKKWNAMSGAILDFFIPKGNELFLQRCEIELNKLRDKSLKKRNGGLARAQQMRSKREAEGQLYIGVGVGKEEEAGSNEPDAGASDKIFWDGAKAYIGGSNPGSLIGKWIKDYGKPQTAQAITAAQLERAADPKSYVIGVLRRGAKVAEDAIW